MEGCHGVPVTPQCWCGAYWNTDCNRHSPGAGQVGIVDIAGTIRKMRRQRDEDGPDTCKGTSHSHTPPPSHFLCYRISTYFSMIPFWSL